MFRSNPFMVAFSIPRLAQPRDGSSHPLISLVADAVDVANRTDTHVRVFALAFKGHAAMHHAHIKSP